MEIVGFVRTLLQRKLVLGILLALATLAALMTAFRIGPSGVERRSVAVGAATSQILVDSAESTLVEGAGTDQIAALGTRARVYAQYLSSRDAVNQIAKEIGVPPSLIVAHGPFSEGTGIQDYDQQGAESRARDLVAEGKEYRLVFEAQEDVPIITVYATGPATEQALGLAKASFNVLERYIGELKVEARKAEAIAPPPKNPVTSSVPLVENIVVRELGAPEGGLVGGSADMVLMVLAFLAVFGIGCIVVAAGSGFMRHWRLAGEMERIGAEANDWLKGAPAPAPPERERKRKREGGPAKTGS
ncbi:MAG TPA: hypothetical protein VFN92_05275 [Solirubrobacterales bacterium]|nr:hypothetical protein [Solirubrobacterales bacterium]